MNCRKCGKIDCDFYKANKFACKDCYKANTAKWRQENLERKKAYDTEYDWTKYGIVDLERARFIKENIHECAICGVNSKLQVDHCHETGTVRSMLCGRCNRSLGGFGDNVELLRKAANYVEEY